MRGWTLALAAGIVGLDQGIKAWVAQSLALGIRQPVWPGVLYLTRVHNRGAAFGLFPQQTWAFALASAAVVGLLAGFLLSGRWRHPWPLTGGALLLGGALGNLMDRARWGYVLDFLELPNFPVFNVADVAIVAGAGLMGLALLLGKMR